VSGLTDRAQLITRIDFSANSCQVAVGFELLQILSQIRKRHDDDLRKNVLVARYAFQPESPIAKTDCEKKQNIVQRKPHCQETTQKRRAHSIPECLALEVAVT
jgi:hypothetical protein